MTTELAQMKFEYKGRGMRAVGTLSDPRFVGQDVCELMGTKDVSDTLRRLPMAAKGTAIVGTPGGPQEMLVVTEAGLYQLAATGRTELAKEFAVWVFSVVLPTIRKKGTFTDTEGVLHTGPALNPAPVVQALPPQTPVATPVVLTQLVDPNTIAPEVPAPPVPTIDAMQAVVGMMEGWMNAGERLERSKAMQANFQRIYDMGLRHFEAGLKRIAPPPEWKPTPKDSTVADRMRYCGIPEKDIAKHLEEAELLAAKAFRAKYGPDAKIHMAVPPGGDEPVAYYRGLDVLDQWRQTMNIPDADQPWSPTRRPGDDEDEVRCKGLINR